MRTSTSQLIDRVEQSYLKLSVIIEVAQRKTALDKGWDQWVYEQ
jgi:hypothetical protein